VQLTAWQDRSTVVCMGGGGNPISATVGMYSSFPGHPQACKQRTNKDKLQHRAQATHSWIQNNIIYPLTSFTNYMSFMCAYNRSYLMPVPVLSYAVVYVIMPTASWWKPGARRPQLTAGPWARGCPVHTSTGLNRCRATHGPGVPVAPEVVTPMAGAPCIGAYAGLHMAEFLEPNLH